MSSRLSVERSRIMVSGCPLAGHSLNQEAVGRCLHGEARVSEPPKVMRARERRERALREAESEATRQAEEHLDILFDDILAGSSNETVVATVEGREGIVHKIGFVYVEASEVL